MAVYGETMSSRDYKVRVSLALASLAAVVKQHCAGRGGGQPTSRSSRAKANFSTRYFFSVKSSTVRAYALSTILRTCRYFYC